MGLREGACILTADARSYRVRGYAMSGQPSLGACRQSDTGDKPIYCTREKREYYSIGLGPVYQTIQVAFWNPVTQTK